MNMKLIHKLSLCGCLAAALLFASSLKAQHLTLEGQTGGFLTPTAYVVYTDKGQTFSHPAVGYHFVNTSKVIGNVHTFSITEGLANRAEFGYTRSVHTFGDGGSGTTMLANAVLGSNALATAVLVTPEFSNLWNYSGMNVFHGKVVAIKDGQFCPWTPGIAVGGIVRLDDRFVSGALNKELFGVSKSYTNGDVYVAVTKTWLHPPLPFLVNFGWKATNASIYGLGGQSTRFGGRLFGGLGIPLPGPFKTAIVPSAGFTQQPPQVKNLGDILVNRKAHLPTTMDYAVRITQATHPHFSFDIGIGQVAGNIGTAQLPTGLPLGYPQIVYVPVNLQARHVLGMGLSYRY